MSNTSAASGHDAHALPTQSAFKKIVSIVVLLGLPLLVVLGLINAYQTQDRAAPGSMSEEAVMARIQKVGSLTLGSTQQAVRTRRNAALATPQGCSVPPGFQTRVSGARVSKMGMRRS